MDYLHAKVRSFYYMDLYLSWLRPWLRREADALMGICSKEKLNSALGLNQQRRVFHGRRIG